jgi:BirA family biotin operon repressor/biotin-[acetyl-CoA-carboxylase] ligase
MELVMIKCLSTLQHQMLRILAEHPLLSLSAICKQLKTNEKIVLPALQELIELNIPIRMVGSDQFQMTIPYQPLIINTEQFKPYLFYQFDVIDSTNQFLKSSEFSLFPVFCHSDMQTAGRGRLGRTWRSDYGCNLYFSSKWKFISNIDKLSGLSLVIGLALIKAIESSLGEADILLKWPNDLLWQDKKLAGILIETGRLDHNVCELIIGVGVNVNMTPESMPNLQRPWTSLRQIYQKIINRSALLEQIIHTKVAYIHQFLNDGLESFHQEWHSKDALIEQNIRISQPNQVLNGVAKGINQKGFLLIETQEKTILEIKSGEASTLSCDDTPNR